MKENLDILARPDSTVHFLTAVTDWMRHIFGEAGVLDHYRGQEGGEGGGNTQLIYYQQIKNISTFPLQPTLMFPTAEDVVGLRDFQISRIVFN